MFSIASYNSRRFHILMKLKLKVPFFLCILCISSDAAVISAVLSSNDRIRGEAQSALTPSYATDTPSSTIGVSGSSATNERRHDNAVFGFTLPTLGAGETISAATFEFVATAYRDQSANDGDVNLDYYLLNTADPNTGTNGVGFFRKDNSPGSDEILIGQLDAFPRIDGNQADILPASAGEVSATLSGSALSYIQGLYDGSGNPTQAEVFFRLNIDSDNNLLQLDRFIIDTSSPALTLTTQSSVIPEPSVALLSVLGASLLLFRRR